MSPLRRLLSMLCILLAMTNFIHAMIPKGHRSSFVLYEDARLERARLSMKFLNGNQASMYPGGFIDCLSESDNVILDHARLTFRLAPINGQSLANISVYAVPDVCWDCDPQLICQNITGSQVIIPVTSDFPNTFRVVGVHPINGLLQMEFEHWFGDRGWYDVDIILGNSPSVTITTALEPYSKAWPIVAMVLILLALNFAIRYSCYFYERHQERREHLDATVRELTVQTSSTKAETPPKAENSESPPATASFAPALVTVGSSPAVSKHRKRYTSLDTFRGISLAIMIFANYNGGFYWYFNHSYWNGVTVADLVFPWFIFMMGVSMAIVFKSEAKKGTPKLQVVLRCLRRGATLFYFGLFIAMANDNTGVQYNNEMTYWATLRIPGVLQRFGVGFFVIGSIVYCIPPCELVKDPAEDVERRALLNSSTGTAEAHEGENGAADWWSLLKNITVEIHAYKLQWLVVLLMQVIWFLITFLVPFPGCPTGYLGPGGIAQRGKYVNCTGGVASWVDAKVLGTNHLFKWFGGERAVYHPVIYHDPEGILGYLNSFALIYFGVDAGRIILRYGAIHHRPVIVRLVGHGSILCLLCAILCGFSQNDGWVPVNKNLWSPSFVYLMGGFGMWCLAILHYVVDVKQWWDGKPFVFMGMNSIVVYLMSELLPGRFPFGFSIPEMTHGWELFNNCVTIGGFMLVSYMLHRKKLYFTV